MLDLDPETLERLRSIGLAPALLPHLQPLLAQLAPDDTLARVAELQREHLVLHDGNTTWTARPLPALRRALDEVGDALAVGDWVVASPDLWQGWWVRQRVPPLNQLVRRLHDGRDKVERTVIVANVDTALLVMGLDGDFNLRRLERYLGLVRLAGIEAVAVLTKSDLCDDADARQRAARAVLPPEVPLLAVNALAPQAALRFEPWLRPGRTLVLLGSSGTGKSTLTNALAGLHGADAQATGGNRHGDGRGRHTTTTRTLHRTPGGACIIDTPGLRTLRLDSDAARLDEVFDDVARLAAQCRFRDCRHEAEPGCAVREAVAPERLRNYRKLLREAERDTMGALERQALRSRWAARSREARVRMAAKRGG